MTAAVRHLPVQRQRRPVRHVLTGHQLNQACCAAGLDDWVGHRGDHPVEDVDAPLSALEAFGRRLGTHRCLSVAGLDRVEWAQFSAGLAAVAPQLHSDVIGGRLLWDDDVEPDVVYLLGIEVTR